MAHLTAVTVRRRFGKNMKYPLLLLVGLCTLLASCAKHSPQQASVVVQSPAASPQRVRRVTTAADVKRTTTSKAAPAAKPALSCLEARSGKISEARTGELFAEFENREQSGAAAPADVLPVSRACP